jgi:kynurenine formamidase
MIELSLPFNLQTQPPESFTDQSVAKRFSSLSSLGHLGTHLDRLLGGQIPSDYFRSRGLCFDARDPGPDGVLRQGAVALDLIEEGDFLLFRTGIMERFDYGGQRYLSEPFAIDWPLLEALLDRRPRFLGLDAKGLRPDKEHAKADKSSEAKGAYVIENLRSLDRLPVGKPFTVYASWFDFGGTGLPVRVMADV